MTGAGPLDAARTARRPARSRVAFAAAHVVADPEAPAGPGLPAALDWDATLAFRHRLWSLGLGVAEAMDTAQRGAGLDWATARELMKRTGAEARCVRGLLACGAGTDQLDPARRPALAEIIAAYEEQIELVEDTGAQVVLMASRALAATARGPQDYAAVYGRLLPQLRRPAILHWLGARFDPALAGYWGSGDLDTAAHYLLAIIREHAGNVDGVKVSLLDAPREIALRRVLPPGVRLYTGDDFHYPELIKGDEHGHSDALLGVFDPIAAPAAEALAALDRGDSEGFDAALAPTLPLARHLFAPPTRHYKTGVVFLAYLAGHQEHFRMVGAAERERSAAHLAELFERGCQAGIFPDPQHARARLRSVLAGTVLEGRRLS
jgi:hypothetical protein